MNAGLIDLVEAKWKHRLAVLDFTAPLPIFTNSFPYHDRCAIFIGHHEDLASSLLRNISRVRFGQQARRVHRD
jgi:hypothetical protein